MEKDVDYYHENDNTYLADGDQQVDDFGHSDTLSVPSTNAATDALDDS